jgi:hypothetical protein
MRLVFHEMKKIWNPGAILVTALVCTLFYWLFMSYFIDFPQGHPRIEEVASSIELLERYGNTLEEHEYEAFVEETRQTLIAEMERHIDSLPVFADAGIFSYEDYERVRGKNVQTEAERAAVWTLLGSETGFVRFRMQALERIVNAHDGYLRYTLMHQLSQASRQRDIDRLNAVMETQEYRNIMDWNVYENTVDYTFCLAVMSVLAVLVLVSPLVVNDRIRNVHLLQYASKHGRNVLMTQLSAVLLSAFVLATVLLLVFGAIYGTNGTWVFRNSGLTSFLNMIVFYGDITYGQYILIYVAMIYVLCLGTAALAFVLARFSRNLIALILNLLPAFAALVALCLFVFMHPFSMTNVLYRATGIPGIEPAACVLLLVVGLTASFWLVRREKGIDMA